LTLQQRQVLRRGENVSPQQHIQPAELKTRPASARRADFDLEPEDLLAFINYHYVTSPGVRKQRFLLATLGFGILAALPIIVVLGSGKPADQILRSGWPMLLAPLGFLVCFPLFYRWGLKRTCRRLLDEGDKLGFYGPRSLALEDYGVRETTIRGETVRAWPSVRKLIILQRHALVYTSATEAFVVPKRAFSESPSFDDFVEFLAMRARVAAESV
jgi:hypothetical protein